MDAMIAMSLEQLRDGMTAGSSETLDHLDAVMQYGAELWQASDLRTLDEIRYRLELETGAFAAAEPGSYALGMAHGLMRLLGYTIAARKTTEGTATLSPLEQNVIGLLAKQPDLTPSEMMPLLGVDNRQQMTNYLRKLRTKQLVTCWEAGKYRWYKLTPAGEQAARLLRGGEEQAASGPKPKERDAAEQMISEKYIKRKAEPAGREDALAPDYILELDLMEQNIQKKRKPDGLPAA